MGTPRFLFPPHPLSGMLIAYTELNRLESEGKYLAQRKFQGSHGVFWLVTDEHGEIDHENFKAWNRTGEPFSTYTPTANMRLCFQSLKLEKNTEYVFNGELLHTKAVVQTTGKQAATNTIALYDILFAGKYLNHETIEQRLALLRKLCDDPIDLEPQGQAFLVTKQEESQLWLAEVFESEFAYEPTVDTVDYPGIAIDHWWKKEGYTRNCALCCPWCNRVERMFDENGNMTPQHPQW